MGITDNGGVTPPPISADDLLSSTIAPLRQQLEQGEAHVTRLRAEANAQETENRKIRKVLHILVPEQFGPSGNTVARKPGKQQPGHVGLPRANGTATGWGISMEKAKLAADLILKKTDAGAEFVTQPEIYKELNWDQGAASSAFKWFRDIEFVRLAGREKGPGGRQRWVIVDREAVDQALKEAQQRREEQGAMSRA